MTKIEFLTASKNPWFIIEAYAQLVVDGLIDPNQLTPAEFRSKCTLLIETVRDDYFKEIDQAATSVCHLIRNSPQAQEIITRWFELSE